MRTEFIEAYEGLMGEAYDRLDMCHRRKLNAIKYCEAKTLAQLQGLDNKGAFKKAKDIFKVFSLK